MRVPLEYRKFFALHAATKVEYDVILFSYSVQVSKFTLNYYHSQNLFLWRSQQSMLCAPPSFQRYFGNWLDS